MRMVVWCGWVVVQMEKKKAAMDRLSLAVTSAHALNGLACFFLFFRFLYSNLWTILLLLFCVWLLVVEFFFLLLLFFLTFVGMGSLLTLPDFHFPTFSPACVVIFWGEFVFFVLPG
jgi:hypothetical protein